MEQHNINKKQKCMHCLKPYHDGGPFFCTRKCVFCGNMGHNGRICPQILPHFCADAEQSEKEKTALRDELDKKDKEIAQLRSLLQQQQQYQQQQYQQQQGQQQQYEQQQQQYNQQQQHDQQQQSYPDPQQQEHYQYPSQHSQQSVYQDDSEDWRLGGFGTSNDSLYSLHGWQPLDPALQSDNNTDVVFNEFVNDE